MRPDILLLPLPDGALLIGPAHSLKAVAGDAGDDTVWRHWRLGRLLAHRVDAWKLRRAALAWGIDHPHRRHWSDDLLKDHVAPWVETGRLAARFVPLFRDEPRRAAETGQLSLHQIGKGPPPAAPPPPPPAASAPPPQRAQVRSAAEVQKDYEDEDAQIAVLRAAAKDGTPFCEPCARAAIRAAKAARNAA
jgi:hypothetical protein